MHSNQTPATTASAAGTHRNNSPAKADAKRLSKAQIAALASRLSAPYASPINLMCDGRRITLEIRLVKALQYRVMTFVDGSFKGAWSFSEQALPEQKFLRKSIIHLYGPAKKAELIKRVGKKFALTLGVDKTRTLFWPDWPNAKAALNHLNKVCESVELIEEAAP